MQDKSKVLKARDRLGPPTRSITGTLTWDSATDVCRAEVGEQSKWGSVDVNDVFHAYRTSFAAGTARPFVQERASEGKIGTLKPCDFLVKSDSLQLRL